MNLSYNLRQKLIKARDSRDTIYEGIINGKIKFGSTIVKKAEVDPSRFYVAESKYLARKNVNGRGVYAKKLIKKGDIIGFYFGYKITTQEVANIYNIPIDKIGFPLFEYLMQLGTSNNLLFPSTKDKYEQLELKHSPVLFINHGDSESDQNCAISKGFQVRNECFPFYYATKDININEELLIDYGANFNPSKIVDNPIDFIEINNSYYDIKEQSQLTNNTTVPLTNFGTTCYINAAFQILNMIKIADNNPFVILDQIRDLKQLQRVINALVGENNWNLSTDKREQQDVSEFMIKIFEHSEYYNHKKNNKIEILCDLHPKKCSQFEEDGNILIIPPKATDVEDGIKKYQQGVDVRLPCQLCIDNDNTHIKKKGYTLTLEEKHKKDAKQSITIKDIGKYIFIQVTKYDNHGLKIDSNCNIQENIKITDKQFSLIGYIVHIGNELLYGHYVSVIKKSNQYYLIDDTDTFLLTREREIELRSQAYVMLYENIYFVENDNQHISTIRFKDYIFDNKPQLNQVNHRVLHKPKAVKKVDFSESNKKDSQAKKRDEKYCKKLIKSVKKDVANKLANNCRHQKESFMCINCKTKLKSYDEYISHALNCLHLLDSRNGLYICPNCKNQSFKTVKQLESHFEKQHHIYQSGLINAVSYARLYSESFKIVEREFQ
ncbi:SET domain-containing protein-lysine N-methyltransferase, partial [Allofrancisella guangzhouensis]